MERYFTTVALVGVNDGNLPVHRYLQKTPIKIMTLITPFGI